MENSYFFGVLRDGDEHRFWILGDNLSLDPAGPSVYERFPRSLVCRLLPPQPLRRDPEEPTRLGTLTQVKGFSALGLWDWELDHARPVAGCFITPPAPPRAEDPFQLLVDRLCLYLPRFRVPAIVPWARELHDPPPRRVTR